VAGRPLEQPHSGRPDHIGPARGGGPEDVVVLRARRLGSGLAALIVVLVGLVPRTVSVASTGSVGLVVFLLDVVRVHAHLP
ncbi:hypothetical protein, partial [Streptomyces anulatus]|uniref:hypothetical protein n=1 Tax=Streptomyces anulatus TaxID=1892 RepID=UPI0013C77DB7